MGRLSRFLVRRALTGLVMVLLVASAGLLLARLAPGDHLSGFGVDPAVAAAERHRLGLDQPILIQYSRWLGRLVSFDLGESTAHPGRPISTLIAARAANSAMVGVAALALATLAGIPLGVVTGSRRGPVVVCIRAATALLLSVPPVVLTFVLLFLASRTGWFPLGGVPEGSGLMEAAAHMALPVLALALPATAALERLQSRAMSEALRAPSILASRARGLSARRVIWRHALRLSLAPVLAVYGVMIGALISGSFVVEYVMTWPGLGRLMYDALVSRDGNLVAACAATGAAFLAAGILLADVALAAIDPRIETRT